MAKKLGLGRGLDALIPVSTPSGESLTEVAISAIFRNPRQVRTHIDQDELEELAASIREHGILQPLVVARMGEDHHYTLIAGQRRLEAAKMADLLMVPAVVRDDPGEQGLLELALIENLQRSDLKALDAALAYQVLADDFALSHDEIARRVGKQRSTISNTVRLLRLPKVVQDALAEDTLSEGHARALLRLPTVRDQRDALATIINSNLNVRQTEDLIRRMSRQHRTKSSVHTRSPEEIDLENRLRESLGTRVGLNRSRRGKGTIVIHFYSDEELNSITDRLLRH